MEQVFPEETNFVTRRGLYKSELWYMNASLLSAHIVVALDIILNSADKRDLRWLQGTSNVGNNGYLRLSRGRSQRLRLVASKMLVLFPLLQNMVRSVNMRMKHC